MTTRPRPRQVGPTAMREAARLFVASLGMDNARFLRENLGYTIEASDALAALKEALREDAWGMTT